MVLNISFKQIDPSDALKVYVTEKSERLKKYFQGKIHITWSFSREKQSKIAHCHLLGNGMDYFGEESTEDFHASVDQVIDHIEKQVRKHKEIVTDHLHHR
jgi:putative sigma-54 modulation protein